MYGRTWTRLVFCDIWATASRKRRWVRRKWRCIICRDRKDESWYCLKGCLNWCANAQLSHASTSSSDPRRRVHRRVHKSCGDDWMAAKRAEGIEPMCPHGGHCYAGSHKMKCWVRP